MSWDLLEEFNEKTYKVLSTLWLLVFNKYLPVDINICINVWVSV